MTAAEYSKLKVTELKELLTSRNLATTGVKSELVSRLVADDANPKTPVAAPATEEKKDDSLNPDDYDINWDDDADHTSKPTTTASKPAPATKAPAPAPASTTTTPAPPTDASSANASEKKKFQFKSIAAQFEEEARLKAEAAEAAKKASEEAKAAAPAEGTEATTETTVTEEPKPTGPISSKLETLPVEHPAPVTIDEELERRKARAARFGMSVEDNEAIKKLERAKKFGAENAGAEGDDKEGEKKVLVVKGLDQALGHDRKRRFEGNGRGEDKRRRGGNFGGQRGPRGGRGPAPPRGGRSNVPNTGGERRSGPAPTGPRKITDDPAERAKAEARAKRFASS